MSENKKCPTCPTHQLLTDRGVGHVSKKGRIEICPSCKGGGVVDKHGNPIAVTLSPALIKRDNANYPVGE